MSTRILAVDDNEANQYVIKSLFTMEGFEVTLAGNGEQALKAMEKEIPDIILCDILMPVMDGYELCRSLKSNPRFKFIPFIFYTATYTDPKDQNFALSLGAEKFLLKPQDPDILLNAVKEVLSSHKPEMEPKSIAEKLDEEFFKQHTDTIQRKLLGKIEELEFVNLKLKKEIEDRSVVENKLHNLAYAIERIPVSIVITDQSGVIEYANARYCASKNADQSQILGKEAAELFRKADILNQEGEPLIKTLLQGTPLRYETRVPLFEGREMVEQTVAYPIKGREGGVSGAVAIIEDITQRKLIQDNLLRNQKMEELGLLAAGVAHDFNNILTAISGFCDVAQLDMNEPKNLQDDLLEIKKASNRAAKLTTTLLSFSRKQEVKHESQNLNTLVMEIAPFLKYFLPPSIKFIINYAQEPLYVLVDKGQMEQILMNLVTNARDAIIDSGTIQLSLLTKYKDDELYGCVEIKDSGMGMDEKTKERIFEPFFTTKEESRGTGLGLSLIIGILENHGGKVEVESILGKGSTFSIFLPMAK